MTVLLALRRLAFHVAVVTLAVALVGCGSNGERATSSPPGASPFAASPGQSSSADPAAELYEVAEYPVIPGSRPHDVAPAADGGVWYTGQRNSTLGHLDPETGEVREIDLGSGAAPHGVILGPDGAPWITDGGLNAIVRVDPVTDEIDLFPMPDDRPDVGAHTATFAPDGVLWFTGQAGVYGRLDPASGQVEVFDAPGGSGPYGITATPDGEVWYASLARSHVVRIDPETGDATVVEPPTANQGARRIWSDSTGRLWVAEWNAGQVAVHDPASGEWKEWRLPGDAPQAYAVYVDENDGIWLTDFGSNAIIRFDPATERFTQFELPTPDAAVRQLLGRPGEVWGAESGADALVVIRSR